LNNKKWSLKLEKVLLYGRLLPSARPILGRGGRKLLPSEKFSAVSPGYTGDECVFSDYKKKTKRVREKREKLDSRVVKLLRPGRSGAHQTIIKGGNLQLSLLNLILRKKVY